MLQWVSTEVIVKNKEIDFFSMKSAAWWHRERRRDRGKERERERATESERERAREGESDRKSKV